MDFLFRTLEGKQLGMFLKHPAMNPVEYENLVSVLRTARDAQTAKPANDAGAGRLNT